MRAHSQKMCININYIYIYINVKIEIKIIPMCKINNY